MNETLQPVVFVIESPNPSDILDGRTEGQALSAALRLADVPNQLYSVYNLEALEECLRRTAVSVRTQTRVVPGQPPSKTIFGPHFHFSAHGNEAGIALTSGEFLPWSKLRDHLLAFAETTGYRGTNDVGLFPVTFSACKGACAAKLFSFGPPHPCFAIVGPTNDVSWAESLTAYVSFFHLLIHRDLKAKDAVEGMNAAAGLDNVFRFTTFAAGGA